MEELYVVIGTDGVDRWVCSDASDNELMSEAQAKHVAACLSGYSWNVESGHTFKVAKLTFLD